MGRPVINEPRLPAHLDGLGSGTMSDETSWTGVEVGSGVAVVDGATCVDVTASRIRQVRFTGCELERLRLVDVEVDDCEFSGAVLDGAMLVRVRFTGCRMVGLVATNLIAQHVRFVDCKIDEANFRVSAWEQCELVDCDLRGADFYAARLSQSALTRCNLGHVEFSQATFDNVALHGSRFDGIRGADALRGVIIGTDQVVPLALPVFAALGITVDDEDPET